MSTYGFLYRAHPIFFSYIGGGGAAVAQSVEHATPGQDFVDSFLAPGASSLLVGSVQNNVTG